MEKLENIGNKNKEEDKEKEEQDPDDDELSSWFDGVDGNLTNKSGNLTEK